MKTAKHFITNKENEMTELESIRVKVDYPEAVASPAEQARLKEQKLLQDAWKIEFLNEIDGWSAEKLRDLSWNLDSLLSYGICSFDPPTAGIMTRMGLLMNKDKLKFVTEFIFDLRKQIENT